MHIILLSGGAGKRLWPLSNEIRSKQFLKILKKADGTYESMIQRFYNSIKKIDNDIDVTIATSKKQVSSIINQLGTGFNISVEPCRKDTFPAIALAAAYLKYEKNIKDQEVIVVCPVDPYVSDEYFKSLIKLADLVQDDDSNIVLMGVEPDYPSDKYGYIIPESNSSVSSVVSFKEKPNSENANHYISKGALWNTGVFAFKLGYVLNKAQKILNFDNYRDLYSKYRSINKISFDYAVVERENKIKVLRYKGSWKDIGSWSTLTETVSQNIIGKGVLSSTCENVNIINDTDIPILSMGMKNAIIVASADGILVSDKIKSDKIKPYVDDIKQQVMFAEKSWGNFKILDVCKKGITAKLEIIKNKSLSYHSHNRRDEVWVIISGYGVTYIEGVKEQVKPGDVILIHAGCKHMITAKEDMQLIEVQIGIDISVTDKNKFSYDVL